jgi:energy-coupling factor transporter ATP-binding protein EcfA2
MPDLLFDRERAALCTLWQMLEERRTAEEELTFTSTKAREAVVADGEAAQEALLGKQERELTGLDAAFHKEQEGLIGRLKADEDEAQQALAEDRQRLETEEREGRERIDGVLKDALWMADSVTEGGQRRLQDQLESARRLVADSEVRIDALWKSMEPLLARVGLDREDLEPEGKVAKPKGETTGDHEILLRRAEELLAGMKDLSILNWLRWLPTLCIFIIAGVAGSLPAVWLRPQYVWLLAGVMAGFLVAFGVRELVLILSRRQLRPLGRKIAVLLTQAHYLGNELLAHTESSAADRRTDLNNKHAHERRRAQSDHRPQLEALLSKIRAERETLEQQFQTTFHSRRQRVKQAVEKSQQRYQETRIRLLARQEKERCDTEAAHTKRLHNLEQSRVRQERQLSQRWETGAVELNETFADLQRIGAEEGKDAPGALSSAASLPFGKVTVDLRQLAPDLDADKLAPLSMQPLQVPAFLPFPRQGGLLMQAFGQGRTVAVHSLQALMLRCLTSLPPGKVRFTIFDPVGLGENFAAFMHLADHDEALVSSRIWTEPGHIEKQLADLTVHMENVIQKYLRSQFSSIEDYNNQADEVAEPYRILVIANFPVSFTPQAARRLVSIVQSGSSCGVYALISLDMRQTLPQGFQVEDLEQLCLNLFWRQERFQWGDSELDRYPLALDMPPEASQVVETVRRIGALSRDANRVQVPFSFIAPTADEYWKSDSRRGLSVPLGRAGAVRKMSLQLGRGTSQHVLVAGKTGSGKSTLWHALIVNMALMYSPDEVELFLIDFKKGVEFKTYAQHLLPHARVIAIESEREFGLSVLQRLDAELKQRGDLFRASGVNDIASYRDAHPDAHCPRILLIVDEFQEFFVEDDRLSQESALLLDRLVRQGRAFGLHILLGSQTLGGAYSLARSTIDQMAVRIALQCSEADAQLILDKDNSAARLLSRPGEAIYNDTNGSIEGNEVFQIVWLPEEQRERVLEIVRARVVQQMPEAASRLPLVFEGNTPAELDRNPLLASATLAGASGSVGIAKAWLGDAIAIKDPTAAVFRAQTGSSLLIVGQDEEAALALMTAALVSLVVQQPSAHFLVLDGTAPHEPHAGFLRSVAEGWPRPMEMVERAGIAAVLTALSEEMNLRLKGTGTDRAVRYVLINGMQRYREFRKGDDDMGFGRRGAERTVSPLEHLQGLLRDGPGVGIYLLIWCDSLTNVMRSLDRQGLRECGQRVLFQMSAGDSSHLLDSPIASRLGRNRALYYTDEMATPEKFRPYGLPPLAWLAEIKQRMAAAFVSPP